MSVEIHVHTKIFNAYNNLLKKKELKLQCYFIFNFLSLIFRPEKQT